MSAFSNYLENLIANNVLGQASMPAIPNLYFALFTAGPTDTGGGTEVSGTGYARVNITNNTTNFPTTSSGLKQNGAAIAWPTAGGSWGTVTHWGIFDASSSGNLLFWGSLDTAKAVASGDVPSLPIGALSIQLD
jgi:hypothetical protein